MKRLAGAFSGVCLAAFCVAGCAAATEDARAQEPAVTGSDAPAVSGEQRQQAQQLAEEAEKIMLDPDLPPRQKYPQALGMFRDALTIDPGNALAQEGITLIEDVYRSMGRPVPQTA